MEKDKSHIKIIEKPDNITFEELYQLGFQAHEENRKKGIRVNTRITNGEQLREYIGEDSISFVALDEDKIIGTVSAKICEGKKWYTMGKRVVYLMHLGVLKEYVGKKVGSRLMDAVEKYALENNADAIDLIVVDNNSAKNIYLHKGYEKMDYIARHHLKQNSVYMIKWLKKSKYPQWVRKGYYYLKKMYICIRFKYN